VFDLFFRRWDIEKVGFTLFFLGSLVSLGVGALFYSLRELSKDAGADSCGYAELPQADYRIDQWAPEPLDQSWPA